MEMIEKHPEKPWDWKWISRNPNITMEFIEKHLEKPWNWGWISENPNITMEMIEKHPDKPWKWTCISKNPNITMEIIEKNINKIKFKYLSNNEFTFENTRIKKKEGYILLEKEPSFHKLQNVYIIKQYM